MNNKITHCTPCTSADRPLNFEIAKQKLIGLNDWQLIEDGRKIKKNFKFKDFITTLNFVNKVGNIAEIEGHHPDIYFTWGKCTIEIYTHAINGLHDNDFILATKIDRL
ncbi:MAG: 4a-hydroxytetrahydrobiopterin dehydratase [Rickettsiales bacterium]|jgi:4a-hydroxytetrahydrobiopterin dehydratase|nr:4a-hydroxytetrahydrobiopterin dehydratase [Rickettsiales bacterium]